MVAQPFETIFEGTDGRYFTEWQVEQRLQNGTWTLCIRQRSPTRLLVETEDEALLLLTPTEPAELPTDIEIRVTDSRARVVNTRQIPGERPNDDR